MKRVSLLLEGGVAGHLSHLYDNRDFTFSEISAILQRATAGQLVKKLTALIYILGPEKELPYMLEIKAICLSVADL